MITYNVFCFNGKVPSMNELIDLKARGQPSKKTWLLHSSHVPGTFRFNLYNKIKNEWKQKVVSALKESNWVAVKACYFSYLVVEKTRKRDPSNICFSAIKFIEDGLVEAGVIENDGWSQVLGINVYWHHAPKREPMVLVIMSDEPVTKEEMMKHV